MSSKIHILHIIDRLYPFGGTAVKLLYQVLNSSQNFKFTICCLVEAGGLAKKFLDTGVDVITLNYKKNYDLRQISDIMRIINERNIDIVHTHFARSNTYGRIAALFTGKPMILSEHAIPRNTALPMFFFDSFLNLFTSYNISNSYATLKSVKKTVFLNRGNMSVIYNGVPDTFKDQPGISHKQLRQEYGFNSDDFIILYVGGFTNWRNHIALIEAVSKLQPRIPRIKMVLIGDGPEYNSLKGLVKKYKLEDKVFILGYLGREKVLQFMSCADIYVNSAILEGFGIATVEAMLCELPVICANSGSLPELIDHNKEGLLFEPKKTEELSQCILELYHSEKKRNDLGKAARKKALNKFNIEQFVRAFEKKYLSMVES